MMELEERFKYLLNRYLNKESTQEEFEELFDSIEDIDLSKILNDQMDKHFDAIEISADDNQMEWVKTHKKILLTQKPSNSKYWKLAIAATFLLCGSFLGFWILSGNNPVQHQELSFKNDVTPSANKAVLTLSNGSKVVLDNRADGLLANEGNVNIEKTADGSLRYRMAETNRTSNNIEENYNSIEIPKGGHYQLILPDGTKVWLNAASSLKYPTIFTGKKRVVILTGEAYFEVAKNKKLPFIVQSRDVETLVLGTHFNINAYNENPEVKATLLEGSINIAKGNIRKLISPGEQAVFQSSKSEFKVINPDLEEVMAWKNGLFIFENTQFDELICELERQYDMSVKYIGKQPIIHYSGVLPRNKPLSQILNVLEETGEVDFGIEGKTITCRSLK